ncbi:MAG TPA: hypothetical protein VEA16_09950 [Vicinamibacterales bacterium]|nr:hypothetical protein [Vicinamibacterales bacterium]
MTGTITALTLAGALTLHAQAPQNPTPAPQTPPPAPQTPAPAPQAQPGDPQRPAPDAQRPATDTQRAAAADQQTVTVTGCLKEEKDVPGRRPNAAERAGIAEDYVLTNVKMASGSSTSGIGLATMYQVKGLAESELKNHIGHQIEVTGRLSGNTANRPSAGGSAGASATTPASGNSDLPDLTATSIKMIAATCPAAQ